MVVLIPGESVEKGRDLLECDETILGVRWVVHLHEKRDSTPPVGGQTIHVRNGPLQVQSKTQSRMNGRRSDWD